jgi:ubiquinone/menaquinone biosynthesis C-methylase UbiE
MADTPGTARYASERARQYDQEFVIRWAKGVRRRAVAALRLSPGERVLDIACGTGLNLLALSRAVGPEGRVVGVDISPDMLEVARRRVERASCQNVSLVNAAIEGAELPEAADAALFSFAHDVIHSPQVVDDALAHVRPDGRVVACGAMQKWFPSRLGWWVPTLFSRRYTGGREPMERPWAVLASRLEGGEVRRLAAYLGTMYIFTARKPGP